MFFCKNLSGAPFLFTVGRRYTFRRYSGAPLEATLRPPGTGVCAMTWRGEWPPSAAESRGLPAETKGARTPNGFLAPLDAPNLPFALTHRRCAAKRGTRGRGSGRRGDCGTHGRPEFILRDLQRCQCAAIRCGAIAPSLRKIVQGFCVAAVNMKRDCHRQSLYLRKTVVSRQFRC